MHVRALMAIWALLLLTARGEAAPAWPISEPMPDEAVRVPRARYIDVGAGTKVFRPVEPMPWGDVNSQVEPKPESKPDNSGHEGH